MLFGGTFDPPHLAHTSLADHARRAIEAREGGKALLAFVPAARSPHKADAPEATNAQRVQMLRLATNELDLSTVWTDELDRAAANEPSYWFSTLQRTRACIGSRTLAFIIGADQAAQFHRWREPRAMLELARPLVLPRGSIASAVALRRELAESGFWNEKELDRWAESFVEVDAVQAASTDVRDAKGGVQDTPLRPNVLAYVKAQGLYGMS